jgi:HlyD family secretion protein
MAAAGIIFIYWFQARHEPASAAAAPTPAAKNLDVACQGRLEPEDGVVQVSAPYFAGRPSIITKLLVKEGDEVKAGQVLAILDGNGPLEAALRLSEARIVVARNHLAQVKAGSRAGDLDAQKTEIRRWQSETESAETEFRRYEGLYRTHDVSASQLEEKRMVVDRARQSVQSSKDKLSSLQEVRQVDVDTAGSEVEAAIAEAQRVRADLDLSVVRAPFSGRAVKVLAKPGEEGSTQGIVELAKTDRMYAIAEVYENDVGRVRIGQRATISSDLFPKKLQGTVQQIGMKIGKSEVLTSDPASFADTRVVKVKVLLEDSRAVAGLINGKVSVVIHP